MEKRRVTLVLDGLTLGDLEAFEQATGKDLLAELAPKMVTDPATGRPVPDPDSKDGRPLLQAHITASTQVGLIFLGMRAEDPAVTIDAVRSMKITDIDFDLQVGADSPLEPEAEPQPPS